MEVRTSQPAAPNENDRLGSWKEIANYLVLIFIEDDSVAWTQG